MVVVIVSESGLLGRRLGNRLFLFSHVAANAMTNNYSVLNPSFWEYCDWFENTSDAIIAGYKCKPFTLRIKSNSVRKFLRKSIFLSLFLLLSFFCKIKVTDTKWFQIIKWDHPSENFNLSDPFFLDSAGKKKIVFLFGGWKYRDSAGIDRNSESIRAFFTPENRLKQEIDEFMAICRKKSDYIVGIHIRRGDYQFWNDGKFYFSFEDYRRIMNTFIEQNPDKKILFLICSNEKISEYEFSGFNFEFGLNHPLSDMYCLAKCNIIAGPPSTFTMWASFYGNIPLLIIRNPRDQIDINHAQIITGDLLT